MNKPYLIISILFLSVLVLVLSSCDKEYVAPPSFVDLSITWTSDASGKESEVNQFYSFSDLSAGVETTEWTIPDNAFFLRGPIPNNLENHDAYIINPGTTTSNDKTVSVLWTKGDTAAVVKYRGVFPDSTSFDFNAYFDNEIGQDVIDTIQTQFVNGEWVAEYSFTVDVYDTIVPVLTVKDLNGTLINHENTGEITLNLGDQLVFEDLSGLQPDNTGRPNNTKWRIHTLEEEVIDQRTIFVETVTRADVKDQVISTLTFDKVGQFRVEMTSSRDRSPQVMANEAIYDIPMIINVVE